jgi:uncharacterized RDD family membrane protein YckC
MQGRRAGVVSRFVAAGIDLAVVLGALIAIYLGYSAVRFLLQPRRFTWPAPEPLHLGTLGWLLLIVYLTVGWATTGRTLGKTVLGLRVIGPGRQGLGLGRALLRACLCALVPIGLLWSAVSGRSASVQDLLVRTSVVYDWEPRLPRLERT